MKALESAGDAASVLSPVPVVTPGPSRVTDVTPFEQKLLRGARSRLGDSYDAAYYSQGYPPTGRSACTDIVYYAYLEAGHNLRELLARDVRSYPGLFPHLGDDAINHRRCVNLIVWFRRHTRSLPISVSRESYSQWRPGDVVFWSMANDGTADHVGIISDILTPGGKPLVIHQFPPKCTEEDVLTRWTILGHFRIDK